MDADHQGRGHQGGVSCRKLMPQGCGTRAHRQHHLTEQGLIAKH